MTDAPRIVTEHVNPPIPVRTSDWCAYYEGHEESGEYGYGATEAEAIADLKDNYGDPSTECPMCHATVDEDYRYCAPCGDFV